jgi:uncharacterized protein YbjT (DUF2867 family)
MKSEVLTSKVALLLGASGSVGKEILKQLLNEPQFENVYVFVRKSLQLPVGVGSSKIIEVVLPDFTPDQLCKKVSEVLLQIKNKNTQAVGFSALGVGAKTAKLTIDQHRAIDVLLNKAFAQGLKSSDQVKSFEFMSAVGANPNASPNGSGAAGMPRYARVKGEAEEAVKSAGPAVVNIYRPAMIRGSLHTPKVLEIVLPIFDGILPKNFRSITTQMIAKAMVKNSVHPHPKTGVLHFSEMTDLAKD